MRAVMLGLCGCLAGCAAQPPPAPAVAPPLAPIVIEKPVVIVKEVRVPSPPLPPVVIVKQAPPPSAPPRPSLQPQPAPPAPPLEPVVLTAIEIGAVKEAVTERLKDPGSAQFGEMRAARQPGKNAIVCGEVNARNSYGGYVGRRTYTGMLISRDGKAYFAVTGMGSTAAERYAIDTMCQRDGLRR